MLTTKKEQSLILGSVSTSAITSSSSSSLSSSSSSAVVSSGSDYTLSSPTSATMSSSSSSSSSSDSNYMLSSPSASSTSSELLSWSAPNVTQSIILSIQKLRDMTTAQMEPHAWLTPNTRMLISVLNELKNKEWLKLSEENKGFFRYQDLMTGMFADAHRLRALTEQEFIDYFKCFLKRVNGTVPRNKVHQTRINSANLTYQETVRSSTPSYSYYGYSSDSYRTVSRTIKEITAEDIRPITSYNHMTALSLLELCQYVHSETGLLKVVNLLSALLGNDSFRSHMHKQKQNLMFRNQSILDLIQMLFIEAIICDESTRQASLVSQIASMLKFIANCYRNIVNKLNTPFRSLDDENLNSKSIQASRLLGIIDPGGYVSVKSRASKGKNFLVCATKNKNYKKFSQIFGYFDYNFIGDVWVGRCFYPSIDRNFVTHILDKIKYSGNLLIFFEHMVYIAIVSEHHKYAFDKNKDLFKEMLDIIGHDRLIEQYNKYFCYQGQISEDVKMIAHAILYHIINTEDSIRQKDLLYHAIFARNTVVSLGTIDGEETPCTNEVLFMSSIRDLFIISSKERSFYSLIKIWTIFLKLSLDFYENMDEFVYFAKRIIAKHSSNIEELFDLLKKQVTSTSHEFVKRFKEDYNIDRNQYGYFMRQVGLMFFMYALKTEPQVSSSSTSILSFFSDTALPSSAMLTQAAMNVCRVFFMASSRSFQYSINEKSDYKAHIIVSPAEEKLLRPGLLGQSNELSELFDSISSFVTLTEVIPDAALQGSADSASLFTRIGSFFSREESLPTTSLGDAPRELIDDSLGDSGNSSDDEYGADQPSSSSDSASSTPVLQ